MSPAAQTRPNIAMHLTKRPRRRTFFETPAGRFAGDCRRWADTKHEPRPDDGRIADMETNEKQRAIDALRALPEHATIEDAIERLCFIAKIEEGLRQSDARQLVSHDEVKKQFLS